jgi:hypothetical protein
VPSKVRAMLPCTSPRYALKNSSGSFGRRRWRVLMAPSLSHVTAHIGTLELACAYTGIHIHTINGSPIHQRDVGSIEKGPEAVPFITFGENPGHETATQPPQRSMSRETGTILYQGTMLERSTSHIGKGVALVAQAAVPVCPSVYRRPTISDSRNDHSSFYATFQTFLVEPLERKKYLQKGLVTRHPPHLTLSLFLTVGLLEGLPMVTCFIAYFTIHYVKKG